ncbi:MAG: hypothetical protein KKE93_00655 [Nanoarchaeota archaeon]|nr:hypothetical protein [Nanoarchaeota archaeon]
MKKPSLFIIFLIFIIINIIIVKADCQKDVAVNYQLLGFKEDDSTKLSEYQFPNFRQDDILRLGKFEVINRANCTYPKSILKIIINSPSKTFDHSFCRHGFEIPKLSPGEIYSLKFVNVSWKKIEEENIIYPKFNYIDSDRNILNLCGIALSPVGYWDSDAQLDEKDPKKSLSGGVGYGVIDNEGNYHGSDFNVLSKTELEAIENTRQALDFARTSNIRVIVLTVVAIIIAIVGVVCEVKLAWATEKALRKIGNNQISEYKGLFANLNRNIKDIGKQIIIELKKISKIKVRRK